MNQKLWNRNLFDLVGNLARQYHFLCNRASGLTRELVLDVPPRARGEQVQFKFSEKLPFEGCWAIDEIVVISGKNRPDHIEEDMDEKYGSGWVTPGVRISVRWVRRGRFQSKYNKVGHRVNVPPPETR